LGAGGRWFKSSRPDHFAIRPVFRPREIGRFVVRAVDDIELQLEPCEAVAQPVRNTKKIASIASRSGASIER
jgi:hypothetical protein